MSNSEVSHSQSGEVEGPPCICRTCRRPLDQEEQYRDGAHLGTVYLHGVVIPGTPEHPVDPVPLEGYIGSAVRVCDFCGAPGPPWDYPVGSFDFVLDGGEEATDGSRGDWAACEICHDFIEAEQWDLLAERSLTAVDTDPDSRQELREFIDSMHRLFATHRTGSATRLY